MILAGVASGGISKRDDGVAVVLAGVAPGVILGNGTAGVASVASGVISKRDDGVAVILAGVASGVMLGNGTAGVDGSSVRDCLAAGASVSCAVSRGLLAPTSARDGVNMALPSVSSRIRERGVASSMLAANSSATLPVMLAIPEVVVVLACVGSGVAGTVVSLADVACGGCDVAEIAATAARMSVRGVVSGVTSIAVLIDME